MSTDCEARDWVPLALVPRTVFEHVADFAALRGLDVENLVLELLSESADAMMAKGAAADVAHAERLKAHIVNIIPDYNIIAHPRVAMTDKSLVVLLEQSNGEPVEVEVFDKHGVVLGRADMSPWVGLLDHIASYIRPRPADHA